MSNYTKTTNFATKDNLSPGNPLKIVKGTEIDTEYNNIATAVATKTDNSAAAITGGAIDGATVGSTTPAAGAFTTLAASSTTTLAGALVGAVTQAAFNTVSTTLNLGGAATAVNIGAATGTATVNNTTLAAKAITASTTLNVTGASTLTGAVTATAGVTGPITSSSVSITGGSITGITDLAVADGGTGASTAAGALNNLLPAQASAANKYLQSDGTNASWDAVSLSTADITGTLAVANGGTGITSFGTGIATFLGTPSSANLAAALTDETGTGSAVFATSPTLVTPNLGTPSAAVLTLATGLPLSTGVTGQLPVANGGTGTASPSIVAGTNVTVTGTWPNQTIAASGSSGTVTSVAATVPSLFSISGSPITTSGTLAMTYSGTALPVANGGTGQTSYTDGQLLIGNTTGNTLTKTTLTAGSNITITNGSGAITIASSGGASAATPTALGTVYGKTNTTNLTFLGYGAGNVNTGTYNTFVGGLDDYYGISAGGSNTSGGNNTAVGSGSIPKNVTGSNITSVGMDAGQNTTAGPNSYFGLGAGSGNTSGTGNIAVGYRTLGYTGAGGACSNNVAIGDSALTYITTGGSNVAVGGSALLSNTTGASNTAVGYQAGYSTTTGPNNVSVGYQALYANTTGDSQVAVGYTALKSSTTGAFNTALGHETLFNLTTGTDNTAVGFRALKAVTTATTNTAIGSNALFSNTTASNNTAVGYQAGYANTTGFITAVGNLSLDANTTGYSNTATGSNSLGANTTGYENTAIGDQAGASVVTGVRNVYVGFKAGSHDSGTHTNNQAVFIGAYARPSAAGDQATIVIGYDIVGKGTDTTFIRNACYQGNNSSSWSTTSDRRLKKNIADNNDGLDKINSIRVRNFEYRLAEEITDLPQDQAIRKTGVQLGVIAQELQAVLPDCVKTESTGVMTVNSDNLTWYMINAIKELKAQNDSLQARLDAANL